MATGIYIVLRPDICRTKWAVVCKDSKVWPRERIKKIRVINFLHKEMENSVIFQI